MTKEVMQQALEALNLARTTHGVMLMSDPPQEAWKTYQVDAALRDAILKIKEALAQPVQPASKQPLTDEDISLMSHNSNEGGWNSLVYQDCWLRGYKEGVHAAEIAHGIGETK